MGEWGWVMYYGRRVEGLEPPGLQERVAGEARRMAEAYGWQVNRDGEIESDSLNQTFASYFGDAQ